MPEGTLNALAEHGRFDSILPADGGDCEEVLSRFARAGIDIDALAAQLQDEGARSFVKSWKELMGCIASKSEARKVSHPTMSAPGINHTNHGAITSVRGSVVDVRFDNSLPPIYSLLCAGKDARVDIEVLMHLDEQHVRGSRSNPTQGLARGMAVEDTGGPLKVPVGKGILSRMFDVFGNAIDGQPAPSDVEWRSIHRNPPPLASRSTKSEVFETGIKVIDVLVPLERGGKAGLFGARAWARPFCSPK